MTARTLPWHPVAASALFALAYTQPPLYFSNQNQYFLHGAALARQGGLASDWLANTADPTPLFTAGVALSSRLGVPGLAYLTFGLLLMAYFLSLCALVAASPRRPRTPAGWWLFAALLTLVHSGVARYASVRLTGFDWPWHLQAGVANQYLLGAGLQPSAFGVGLLAALAAFAHGRTHLAALFVAAACSVHPTYLLPAALLTLGMLVRAPSGQTRLALAVLAAALPAAGYTLWLAARDGPEAAAESHRILAAVRIPHHCLAGQWCDAVAACQLALVAAALPLVRRTRWGQALAVAAGLATLASLAQFATGSMSLALLFPWRLSAVAVPVATALLLALAVSLLEAPLARGPRVTTAAALLALAGCVAGAAIITANGLAYQVSAAETGVQAFVAASRRPGEVYLLPAAFPPPPKRPGSASSSFVPVPQTGRPAVFELQRFRLTTGAAVYVDFKSIPYAAADVLEWHARVSNCVRWYATPDWDAGIVNELRALGVTHVVVPAGVEVRSTRLREVYADAAYRLYALEAAR